MDNLIWKYIDEQPSVLTGILDHEESNQAVIDVLKCTNRVIITASGSSLNAAIAIQSLMKKSDLDIRVVDPFDFRFNSNLSRVKEATLICLSQTGKSVGTLDCITLAQKENMEVVAFTADSASEIAITANYHINVLCNEELVGPKTKGFTATVLMLHLFLLRLSKSKELIRIKRAYKCTLPYLVKTVQSAKRWCENHPYWAKVQSLSIVGYGIQQAIAKEGALKLLETMQIPIMNYSMEEFMHGPHRTITKQSNLIYILNDDIGKEAMQKLISFTQTIANELLVITDCEIGVSSILVDRVDQNTSWLLFVTVFQVMCSFFPELNGINPSEPIYGHFAKMVGTRL